MSAFVLYAGTPTRSNPPEEGRDTVDRINRNYLTACIKQREISDNTDEERAYVQGRIDEFCAQNAINQEDAPGLDLRLTEWHFSI